MNEIGNIEYGTGEATIEQILAPDFPDRNFGTPST